MGLEAVDRAFVEKFYMPSKRQSEVVIYYRRPEHVAMPGWIIWADSQLNKQATYILHGFTPLTKYGQVGREDSSLAWAPILNHPDGPAEFPTDQVLTFRWHDPDYLPRGVRQDIYFPQLADVEIKEFDCIECENRTFRQAIHLARHLRISHDYDRAEIIALGEQMGIDFKKEFAPKSQRVTRYARRDIPVTGAAPLHPAYRVEKVHVPSRDELMDAKPKRKLSPEAAQRARENLARGRELRKLQRETDRATEAAAEADLVPA